MTAAEGSGNLGEPAIVEHIKVVHFLWRFSFTTTHVYLYVFLSDQDQKRLNEERFGSIYESTGLTAVTRH